MRSMMHGWRLKGRERAREQETERESERDARHSDDAFVYADHIFLSLSPARSFTLSLSLSHGIGSRQQQRQHLQQQWQQQWQQQQWQQQQQQWQQQRQHWHFAGIWLCRHLHKDPNQRLPYPNGIVLIQQTEASKAEQTMPKQDAALLVHARVPAPAMQLCPLPDGAEATPSRMGQDPRALLGARDA